MLPGFTGSRENVRRTGSPHGPRFFSDDLNRHTRHGEYWHNNRQYFRPAPSSSSQYRPQSARSQASELIDEDINVSAGAQETSCMRMQEFQKHQTLHIEELRDSLDAPHHRLREIAGPLFPLTQAGAGHLGSLHSSVRAYHVTWHELKHESTEGKDVIAVKMIKLRDKGARSQARKEIDNIASLSHVHIVAFIDSFVYSATCHIVMYPAAQFDLAKYLLNASKLAQKHGDVNRDEHKKILQDIRRFFSCLCSALQYIHTNMTDIRIKHGDIKPGNILVDRHRNILLTDFGISKIYAKDENPSTLSATVKGTPMYAAPEVLGQSMSHHKRGLRIDIFSLGCVFLEMASILAGHHIESVHEHFLGCFYSDVGMDVMKKVLYGSTYGLSRLDGWKGRLINTTQTGVSQHQIGGIVRMMSEEPAYRPTLVDVWNLFQGFRQEEMQCPCASDWPDDRRTQVDAEQLNSQSQRATSIINVDDPRSQTSIGLATPRTPQTGMLTMSAPVASNGGVLPVNNSVSSNHKVSLACSEQVHRTMVRVRIFNPRLQKTEECPASAISGKRILVYDGYGSRITSSLRANFDCKPTIHSYRSLRQSLTLTGAQRGVFILLPRFNGWRYVVPTGYIDLWATASLRQNVSRVAGSTRYLFAREIQ